jgi:UDP-3-O-[3-hydroxymyristoyl] glucosamine N-acyltransferase
VLRPGQRKHPGEQQATCQLWLASKVTLPTFAPIFQAALPYLSHSLYIVATVCHSVSKASQKHGVPRYWVQDGAVLRYAMVCEEAVVGAGAAVEAGAIVSYRAVIGPRATLPRYARISLCRQIAHEVREGAGEHVDFHQLAVRR